MDSHYSFYDYCAPMPSNFEFLEDKVKVRGAYMDVCKCAAEFLLQVKEEDVIY